MTEIKPGKWRLADGREVVVFADSGPYGWPSWIKDDNTLYILKAEKFEGASYLGPAVIGDAPDYGEYPNYGDYWHNQAVELQQQCKQLEAETVAARELLEKSEERCEELAKELGVFRDTINGFSYENRRLKRGDFTEDEFQNLCNGMTEDDARRFKAGCFAYWPKLFGKQGVAYEFTDGVEIYHFRSVTIMVRGDIEAICYKGMSNSGRWYVFGESEFNNKPVQRDRKSVEHWCREHLEQECREQLEPRWREATEADRGKACRVKDFEGQPWEHDRTLVGRNENIVGGPWATVSSGGSLSGWRYCEVQD